MNNLTIQTLKVVLVTNLFILLSCNKEKKDDLIIIDVIINQTSIEKEQVIINQSRNNDYLISVIKKIKKYDLEKIKLDSLKQVLGIKNNEVSNEIFNENQYNYLLSQKSNLDSKWNFNSLSDLNKKKIEESKVNKLINNITISKPIYTKNKKYALVYICKKSWCGIQIFHFLNNKWVEIELISPMLISKKAKILENT